jgi:MFS transporter, DHA1 family, inner membrane transport protein
MDAAPSPRHVLFTILSLAVGAFAIGTSEFAAMGLLPYYAAGFGITEPQAGHAVSAYAIGVVIGAPVLAIMGARLSRKMLLVWLIAFFALANALTSIAPSYETMVLGRFLCGLPHGTYLGGAMLFAAGQLPKGFRAQGMAYVMLGLTIATTIGVPLANTLGQYAGWRSGFAIVSGLALLAALMIWRNAPQDARDPAANPLRELGALKNRAVWLTLLVGAVGFGGVFAFYSYLSATMLQVTQAPGWAISLTLCVFGAGATIGNLVSGRLASISRFGSALGFLIWMMVTLAIYTFTIHSWPLMALASFLIGLGGGMCIPLQMRLMDVAGEAQTMAAALNHAAFNFANALGPFLAGLALSAGWGWTSPGWVGAGLAAAGIGALAIAYLDARKEPLLPDAEAIHVLADPVPEPVLQA